MAGGVAVLGVVCRCERIGYDGDSKVLTRVESQTAAGRTVLGGNSGSEPASEDNRRVSPAYFSSHRSRNLTLPIGWSFHRISTPGFGSEEEVGSRAAGSYCSFFLVGKKDANWASFREGCPELCKIGHVKS